MSGRRDLVGRQPTEVEVGRPLPGSPVPGAGCGRLDRAVAVASQVDGLEHAVPLSELTLARSAGQWPLALCAATVVPAALGASGRDCRRCRHLVLATRSTPRRDPLTGWWRRLLGGLGRGPLAARLPARR